MRALTPYDTGEVLEPHVWPKANNPSEYPNFGKVDFDNEEGGTDLTLRVMPDPDNPHGFVIEVTPHSEAEVRIV